MALGLIGAGVASDAGLALLSDDPPRLTAALAGIGELVDKAHLQADLTAMVAGTPSSALADTLAAVADRESSGAASVWRFSPDTVRRALDSGWTAESILDELTRIAAGGVPQALTYLIRDMQRRHGVIRASTVACCLRSDDTALLAEVAADRRLRRLGLRLIAPTVLAGAKPVPETIAALRKAGYAPVEENADGSAVIEATTRRRTTVARQRRPDRTGPATTAASGGASVGAAGTAGKDHARDLARTLLDRPDGVAKNLRVPPRGEFGAFDEVDAFEALLFGGRFPPRDNRGRRRRT
jgi:hypothetical protein